jgi:ComF family protein
MKAHLSALSERVADWFYPRVCPGCGEPSDRPGRHLCWACFRRLDLHTQSVCSICGHPAEGDVKHAFVCGACREVKPAFDKARAAGHFQGVLRELVHQFKYGQALWLKHDLADLLAGCLEAHFSPGEVDVVVPVPLHPVRQRERSYNQAALLGEELAQRIGRRFDGRSLVRVKKTESQTLLDAAHRRMNALGAFAVAAPEWVAQRRVLLVDDVMTTGATLSECARMLKKAGAHQVWAATVARG